MKKIFQIACCASGGILTGYFANQLHTIPGSILFFLGLVILVISAAAISKQYK